MNRYDIHIEPLETPGSFRQYVGIITDSDGQEVWRGFPEDYPAWARADAENAIADLRSIGR